MFSQWHLQVILVLKSKSQPKTHHHSDSQTKIEHGSPIQIADYFQNGWTCPEEFAVGLQSEFKPLEGHDIGQFPGMKSKSQ